MISYKEIKHFMLFYLLTVSSIIRHYKFHKILDVVLPVLYGVADLYEFYSQVKTFQKYQPISSPASKISSSLLFPRRIHIPTTHIKN